MSAVNWAALEADPRVRFSSTASWMESDGPREETS
jgi:hypothetical protein